MAPEKAPAFQFYPKDFLSDGNQGEMSLAEAGAYARLMCRCWLEKTIPDDPARAANLCGATPTQMKKLWPAIRRCFRPHPDEAGRLIHPRLEKERTKQETHRQRQSDKGTKGAEKRWHSDSTGIAGGMAEAKPDDGSPISSLLSPKVPKEQEPTTQRSKRPIFTGQRLTVFEWMFDNCCKTLGNFTNDFDLHEWFAALDTLAARTNLVIPRRDNGQWLEARLLEECQRRGLPIARTQRAGKLTTNLAAALENIQAVGE